jgi:hypothetical protein
MASSGFSLMASSGFSLVALFKSEQEQRNVKTRKMATIILRISPPFIQLHCYHNYLEMNINDNGMKSSIFAEVNDLLFSGRKTFFPSLQEPDEPYFDAGPGSGQDKFLITQF